MRSASILYELLVGRTAVRAAGRAVRPAAEAFDARPRRRPAARAGDHAGACAAIRAIARPRRRRWRRSLQAELARRSRRAARAAVAGGSRRGGGRRDRSPCCRRCFCPRGARAADRPGHDRPGRLHEHDRRAGVRRHAQGGAGGRPRAVAVPEGVSGRSRARDAAADAARARRARHASARARDRAARAAEGAGRRIDRQPGQPLRARARGGQRARPATSWRASRSRPPARKRCSPSLGTAASKLREKLGESLASIQKFDVPLPRATTPSLEALHAYSLALDQGRTVPGVEAIPHLKRAIELDPDFAMAQALLSGVYANTGRTAEAPVFARRAFELRGPGERARAVLPLVALLRRRRAGVGQGARARAGRGRPPIRARRSPSTASASRPPPSVSTNEAIRAFREAIRLDPKFVPPHRKPDGIVDRARPVRRSADGASRGDGATGIDSLGLQADGAICWPSSPTIRRP